MTNEVSDVVNNGSRLLSNKQRLLVGCKNAIFLYLIVINFCDEYWDWGND